jgi:hypothetical protein
VNIDGPRFSDDPVDHRSARELDPPRATAGPQHQLRRVLCPRELDQCLAHVVADDFVIRASHRHEKRSMLVENLLWRTGGIARRPRVHTE